MYLHVYVVSALALSVHPLSSETISLLLPKLTDQTFMYMNITYPPLHYIELTI